MTTTCKHAFVDCAQKKKGKKGAAGAAASAQESTDSQPDAGQQASTSKAESEKR